MTVIKLREEWHSMNCPECNTGLEFISGQYNTGVVAPDGYRESIWQEGYYCSRCNYIFDLDDLNVIPGGEYRDDRNNDKAEKVREEWKHYYCDEGTDDDPTPVHRCDQNKDKGHEQEETIEETIRRGTVPCPRCQRILLVDTKGNVTQCNHCGDKAFVYWNLFVQAK